MLNIFYGTKKALFSISLIILFWSFNTASTAAEGLVALKSPYSVSMTLDRLENILNEKGMKIFTRIDHAKGAASVGNELRPTTLLIFGNPKIGSVLMSCAQSAAIDLPQKALAWEDEGGVVWLGYNDPGYLDVRHNIGECNGALEKVSKALSAIFGQAVSE